jgi:hypothetical protein
MNCLRLLNTGAVGSNPTRGTDVTVYSVFVLPCVGSGLATAGLSTRLRNSKIGQEVLHGLYRPQIIIIVVIIIIIINIISLLQKICGRSPRAN